MQPEAGMQCQNKNLKLLNFMYMLLEMLTAYLTLH